MLLYWMPVAGAAALPEVAVSWRGEAASLSVDPPAGFEISPESPADLSVRWSGRQVSYAVSGRQVGERLDLWAIRGQTLEGDLGVTLCDKSDGLCTTLKLAVDGAVPDTRRGRVLLSVSLASPPPIDHPQFRTDARALADAAFAAVKGTDRRVLLDFSAVWCPPCNQLAAEVLHAATPPTILDQFEVVVLDVDDPRSWALKDRYQVGGYPTVVIADAEGQEVGREVGFPGRERFVLWLEEMAQRTEKAPDYTHVDPATLTPEQAGEVAWQLVKRGQGAGAWIARAEEAEPTTALRLARVRSAPNIKDVSWLADHAPERTLDWISGVASLREDPAGRDVMRRAIALALPGVRGAEAADLLYYSAQLASEEEAPVLYAAAASLLRESFTGEPFRDRAHVTFLASLLAKSGDLPAAVDALRDATARWPGEPTFLLTEARLQLEAGDSRAALAAGEACMGSAWGDNRLRCAALVCEALTGLDRGDEARSRAEAVLTEIAPPDPSLDVRAPRYRRALQAYIDAP